MLALTKKYMADNFQLKDTNILVILNGVYQPELSDPLDLDFSDQVIKVPQNTKLDNPIHLLFLGSQDYQCKFDFILEENSSAVLIEEHASVDGSICSSVIENNMDIKAGGKLAHYRLQLADTDSASCKVMTTINQGAGSRIDSNFISKGSKKYLDQVEIKLSGQEAFYDIKGISLLDDNQVMDQVMRVWHLAPNCKSNVLAKVIVDDKAKNSFDCRVVVPAGVIKTEAHVNNRNLLLSEDATAESSPELEVYVDDVVCTHGSTVGQLDQDALFYLRSRGVDKDDAEQILIAGFIKEILANFSEYPRFAVLAGFDYEH